MTTEFTTKIVKARWLYRNNPMINRGEFDSEEATKALNLVGK